MEEMGRHVVIVDREPSCRDALRAALALSPAEVLGLDDLARLPAPVECTDLIFLGVRGDADLESLRGMRSRAVRAPAPVIALVPHDRADLRLAALRAGAEEATLRDTAPRVLQARLRSVLRHREATQDSPAGTAVPLIPGLAEGTTPFLAAPSSRQTEGQRVRLGLLSCRPSPASSTLDALADLLGATGSGCPRTGPVPSRRPAGSTSS